MAKNFDQQKATSEVAQKALSRCFASTRGEKIARLEAQQHEVSERIEEEERKVADLSAAVEKARTLQAQLQVFIDMKLKRQEEEKQRKALEDQEALLRKLLKDETSSLKICIEMLSDAATSTKCLSPEEHAHTKGLVSKVEDLEEEVQDCEFRLRDDVLPKVERLLTALREHSSRTGEGAGRLQGEAKTRKERCQQLSAELASGTYRSLRIQLIDCASFFEREKRT